MTNAAGSKIRRDRVVAVVAVLPNGEHQLGSGYLITGRLVLTAEHCTVDNLTHRPAKLRIRRATDGSTAGAMPLVASDPDLKRGGLDLALLELDKEMDDDELEATIYARVDRSVSGVLHECEAIGYPLFQRHPVTEKYTTAELHGTIYQTDLAESGRLLLREPLLQTVAHPEWHEYLSEGSRVPIPPPLTEGVNFDRRKLSPWGGLSGALVFHAGLALGVVVEHHERQGASSFQITTFDQVLDRARQGDKGAADIAAALGLSPEDDLQVVFTSAVESLRGLVEILAADGELQRVESLNPYELGATNSDYGDQGSYGERDPYVARTSQCVDARLEEALKPGTFTVLLGQSKAGKSRTAFEVLRRRWPSAYLLAPPTPAEWERLLSHPRVANGHDPIVVWLDDIDQYLIGRLQLTPARLNRLLARPGQTVVLGTLRRDRRDLLRDGNGELSRDTRRLLETATIIELGSTAEDPVEQAAARAAYPCEHFDESGVAELLAHGPELLRRYRDSGGDRDPIGHLMVQAAVDWARVGMLRPIPESELMVLARNEVWAERPDLDPDDSLLAKAIEWARRPLPGRGHSALLTTHHLAPDSRTRGYWPFDYLVAADDDPDGQPRAIRPDYWHEILQMSTTTPVDASLIGIVAHLRGADMASECALLKAGDPESFANLGLLMCELDPPEIDRAKAYYTQASNAGISWAMVNLAILLAERLDPPDMAGARDWLQKAADAGDMKGMHALGKMLATNGDPPDLNGARAWYERAGESGNSEAMFDLGVLLADRLDPPDLTGARAWYERSAQAGNTKAMTNLGALLALRIDPPDLVVARDWYSKAANAGNPLAMFDLAVFLLAQTDPPDSEGARTWSERAAHADEDWDERHAEAMCTLAGLLVTAANPKDVTGARAWYSKAAELGSINAMVGLGVLLATKNPPDIDGARGVWQKAADAGNTDAMVGLGILLATKSPPDIDGARGVWQKAIDAGNTDAMVGLGTLLATKSPPDIDSARGLLQRAADVHEAAAGGHADAMYQLGGLLSEMHPTDFDGRSAWLEEAANAVDAEAMTTANGTAIARAERHVATDFRNRVGLDNIVANLQTPVNTEDLTRARYRLQKSADAGNPVAMFNLGVLLVTQVRPPDVQAARILWRRAAEAGVSEAKHQLAMLDVSSVLGVEPTFILDEPGWTQRRGSSDTRIALDQKKPQAMSRVKRSKRTKRTKRTKRDRRSK